MKLGFSACCSMPRISSHALIRVNGESNTTPISKLARVNLNEFDVFAWALSTRITDSANNQTALCYTSVSERSKNKYVTSTRFRPESPDSFAYRTEYLHSNPFSSICRIMPSEHATNVGMKLVGLAMELFERPPGGNIADARCCTQMYWIPTQVRDDIYLSDISRYVRCEPCALE